MIIKQDAKSFLGNKNRLFRLFFVLLGLCLCYGLYTVFAKKKEAKLEIKTSFENTKEGFFSDGTYLFSDTQLEQVEGAKTGKKALLIASDSSKIAPLLEIENPANLYANISVWIKVNKGNPTPIINVNSKEKGKFNRSFSGFEQQEGWSKMDFWFFTPDLEEVKTLVFDFEVKGKGAIYFDDFEINFSSTYPAAMLSDFKPSEVNLRIDEQGMAKLKKIRDRAISNFVLISSDDDWVDAKLEDGDTVLEAKVRLKGDWTDHLKGTKWSYRVKFKKDHTWKRLKTVSFQTPEARNFLYEWILHLLWEKEDILTTRYDYITLKLNGESKGVYAYEEHFEKQLLEYKSRREGPIVRYDESVTWETRERIMKELNYLPSGYVSHNYEYEGAEVTPFGTNKISKSPVLSRHMAEAHNLLYQCQHQLKAADELFDVDLLAKYYAICDVTGAHHGSVWHNQRFYYNPVLNKLEPIGYDGNVNKQEPNLGYRGQIFFGHPKDDNFVDIFRSVARDTNFIHKYVHYLNKFTKADYIADFHKTIKKEGKLRETFLRTEFKEANFETYWLKTKGVKIQALLQPYNEKTLIAYTASNEKKEGIKTIKIKNKLGLPMLILGTGKTKKGMDHQFENPDYIWGYAFSRSIQRYNDIEVPSDAKYVYGSPIGLDTIVYSTISPVTEPQNHTASQEIFENVTLDTSGIYQVYGDRIIFKTGTKATIKKNIIIPKGYTVVFEEGVSLDFIDGTAFMSKSPVEMHGTETYPILISSSDQSAKGFTVLQADKKSVVQNVLFSHLDTWSYKNWVLTGAVTFYESEVEMDGCIITENSCEDALNIVRSKFEIANLTISNTFGDGFDADFCRGRIEKSRFINTGNDGMDFSGGIIVSHDCLVENSGDKGLSVGEESKVRAHNLTINGAVLGVASKDLSLLNLLDLKMENCEQGFAAFRKKPEYGGGRIYVERYEVENVKRLHVIEKGSFLKLDDQMIKE